MNTKNIAWSADIGCDGGPVIVANLADFSRWYGSEPYDASQATELHHWSPFAAELPEIWRPAGPTGHQYLASANPSAARAALMSVVLELWPGATIDRSEATWRAIRPDGRILNAALAPDSEYDRAIRSLGEEALHGFQGDAMGYLWSAAPGMVRISVDDQRDFLVLSQVEFANDEADALGAHRHALEADWRSAAPGQRYRVTAGPVVAAWSPNSIRDLSAPISAADAAPSLLGKLLDMATGASGALLWLKPGMYESALHYHAEASWGVAWCRLQRVGK